MSQWHRAHSHAERTPLLQLHPRKDPTSSTSRALVDFATFGSPRRTAMAECCERRLRRICPAAASGPHARSSSYAFDLLDFDGTDLRAQTLASLLRGCGPGLRICEHLTRRRHRVLPRLQAGLRGHRLEGVRLAVYFGPHAPLAQIQEPGRAGSAPRGQGRLEFGSDGAYPQACVPVAPVRRVERRGL
jgi:hypothetical protein